MYYDNQPLSAEQQQNGMGFLPILAAAAPLAAAVIPAIGGLFKKKQKAKGPTKAELEQMRQAAAAEAAAVERKKYMTYGAIGLGVVAVGVVGYILLRKKKK